MIARTPHSTIIVVSGSIVAGVTPFIVIIIASPSVVVVWISPSIAIPIVRSWSVPSVRPWSVKAIIPIPIGVVIPIVIIVIIVPTVITVKSSHPLTIRVIVVVIVETTVSVSAGRPLFLGRFGRGSAIVLIDIAITAAVRRSRLGFIGIGFLCTSFGYEVQIIVLCI
jgi:membrane protein